MIKMVASDLDGTLLTGGRQTLPEEIFPLVKELKKMGMHSVSSCFQITPSVTSTAVSLDLAISLPSLPLSATAP